MQSPPAPPSMPQPRGRGSFFLIDRPTFAKVCELGADVCASYLILAAGTGHDNVTTSWSSEAINRRTNLNWRKAQACMQKLEAEGLMRWVSGRGTRKPRIKLPHIETRRPMQRHVAELAERIAYGHQPEGAKEKAAATLGRDQGWFSCDDSGTWAFVENRPMDKAYLPNALVGDETGRANGAATVVEHIRKARDPMAFRLLVDLYALQDLAELGGVNRAFFYKIYERAKVVASPAFQIWHFSNATEYVSWLGPLDHHKRKPTAEEAATGANNAVGFFAARAILQDAGALEWALHLVEDADPDSSLIYPVAVTRHGKVIDEELESLVGRFAIRAGCALANKSDEVDYWEGISPNGFILPAERMARQAQLVGVPRLRFRARTSNTSRWRSDLNETAFSTIEVFKGIIQSHAPELLVEVSKAFADFKYGSTETSTMVQRDINAPSRSGKRDDTPLRVFGDQGSPNDDLKQAG